MSDDLNAHAELVAIIDNGDNYERDFDSAGWKIVPEWAATAIIAAGYVKTPSVQKVAAAISGQCGHKWEDVPPMSANAYLRMAQSVLDLFDGEPDE
jgi:hypothetical protein